MTLQTIIEILSASIHTPLPAKPIRVLAACGSDLMSDVISFVKSDVVLLTGLNTVQTIRTAIVMDIKLVVIVRGKTPAKALLELANQHGIMVLSTSLPMFVACGKLYEAGLHWGGSQSPDDRG